MPGYTEEQLSETEVARQGEDRMTPARKQVRNLPAELVGIGV